MAITRIVKKIIRTSGYELVPQSESKKLPPDLTETEREIFRRVEPFTMTSVERIVALAQAMKYVSENNIAGDFVECGVWRGGSTMAAALMLKKLNDTTRRLFLYDTFEGMPAPGEEDRQFDGTAAETVLNASEKNTGAWCYADEPDVRANLALAEYPDDKIICVAGKVEDTIPRVAPQTISLLRLDTDWYESTRHELEHLYPRLTVGGVLIIDDYGHWQGAKQATDEYFQNFSPKPFLQRIDYTGRMLVKI